ncbi:MAG: substrate-binding domain-containing protein [Candidatus Cryptobacteroides sp.]
MDEKKITIFDVAALAGVSKGTVDRVLHNRGQVSKKSAEKVRKAIEELNFEPNLYASMLASKKNRVIACLLPESEPGEFWDMIRKGCVDGGEANSSLNISTRIITYDQYDPDSFDSAYKSLLALEPSGVVLPPLFKNGTMALALQLKSKGIPYVYVDTKLEEADYFAYFGMPMYQSGYLCAALLTERLTEEQVKDIVVVRILRDKSRQSDPTVSRREGFNDYVFSHFPDCRIHNIFIEPSRFGSLDDALKELTQDKKLVVMFNSRIHLITDYLRNHPSEGRRVIGFDNLEKNVEALRNGDVTLLIAHRTEQQAFQAVSTLSDYIVKGKKPSRRDNYAHMDILSRLNIDNY